MLFGFELFITLIVHQIRSALENCLPPRFTLDITVKKRFFACFLVQNVHNPRAQSDDTSAEGFAVDFQIAQTFYFHISRVEYARERNDILGLNLEELFVV